MTSFYKDKDHYGTDIGYMFSDEVIIMETHGENPPLMKTRKKIFFSKKQDYSGKVC